MSDWEFIEVEREGRVGIIRFNRPDRLNAMGTEIGSEIYYAFEEFNADPDIGAIVTTGNGRAYSSGADLSARMSGEAESAPRRPAMSPWVPEYLALRCKPLIAAVNGVAVGVGLTSLLWYDSIIASTQARFSMRFAAIGLTPELGSAWALPRIVGLPNAKEMMLTGKIYNAQEALEFGLVHRLVEPDQLVSEAIALGEEIAANPASTLRTIKEMTYHELFSPSYETTDRRSTSIFNAARETAEHREAVRAFAEKRSPRFHDVDYMRGVEEEMRQG